VIVIDSSAFTKFLLREEGWEKIIQYLDPDMDPHTIDLLLIETSNAIWKYCRLYGALKVEQALRLFEYMLRLFEEGVLNLEESSKYLKGGLEMSLEYNSSIYDALFIVQARDNDAVLVTSDRGQEEIARKLGVDSIVIP